MCGHDWCSMRISKEIVEFASGKDPNFQPDRRVQRSPGLEREGRELLAKRATTVPVVDGRRVCHSEVAPEETTARAVQSRVVLPQ
jgi:phosphomethylpyrimidine synthase